MNNPGPYSKWHNLESFPKKDLNQAVKVCHQSSQLVAIAGKYLIPPKRDDSHTSMLYKKGLSLLLGEKISGRQTIRVALDIRNLKLMILTDKLEMLAELNLKSQRMEKGFDFLKAELNSLGVDTSEMNFRMHYTFPYKNLLQTEIEMFSEEAFRQHALLRGNAELILHFFSGIFMNSDKIRVWPHHFDTGIILYKRKNSSGKLNGTIGAGFSIADKMIDQPYFYINYWTEKAIPKSFKSPELKHGQWGKDGWKGASLKIKDIYKYSETEEQVGIVSKFFSTCIDHAIDILSE